MTIIVHLVIRCVICKFNHRNIIYNVTIMLNCLLLKYEYWNLFCDYVLNAWKPPVVWGTRELSLCLPSTIHSSIACFY